ncbi:hypothetical protein V6N11_024126 [Hibiscus sabdariffa]|uniref:Uncharacterized protein n=1 Tax=Hibiscus sabdariffa TaxID=183260 RepID=A0ABR1ZV93_9ROSI
MVLGTLPYPPITPSERSHSHFYSDPAFICRPIKKDTQPSRPHVPHKCKGTPGAGGLCTQTLSLLFQQFFMSPPVVFIVPYRLVHGSWIPA